MMSAFCTGMRILFQEYRWYIGEKAEEGKKPEIKKEAGIPGQKEMEQQSMKEKGVGMDGGMPFSSAKGNTEQ